MRVTLAHRSLTPWSIYFPGGHLRAPISSQMEGPPPRLTRLPESSYIMSSLGLSQHFDGWATAPPPGSRSAALLAERELCQIWQALRQSASKVLLSDRLRTRSGTDPGDPRAGQCSQIAGASARWGAAHVGGRPAPEQPQSSPRSGRRFGDPRAGRCSQIASAPDLAPTWAIREQGSALRSSGPLPDGAGPRSKGAAPEQP